MKITPTILIALLIYHFSSTGAMAQAIGVQFVQAGPALAASDVAGVIPQSHFNLVYVNYIAGVEGTTSQLVNDSGNITGVTLTHVSLDGFNSGTDTDTPDGILLHGEDKTTPAEDQVSSGPTDTATYTFNNVPAGTYDVIAYIENDESDVTANITLGSTTYYVTDESTTGTPLFVQATSTNPNKRTVGNYVEFYNVTPSNGRIVITNTSAGGGNDTAAFNGLQLVATGGAATLPAVTIRTTGDGMAVPMREKGKVIIERTGDSTTPLTVFYKTKGSAVAGIDYKTLPGSVTIPAGVFEVTVKIKAIENMSATGTRKLKVKLMPSAYGSYNLSSPASASVTISSDD